MEKRTGEASLLSKTHKHAARRQRVEQQLQAWVAGHPYHNLTDDECCPDFSCCRSSLLAPESMRIRFKADPSVRSAMLGQFLSAAIAAAVPEKTVYTAGEDRGEA